MGQKWPTDHNGVHKKRNLQPQQVMFKNKMGKKKNDYEKVLKTLCKY